ncbi:MAG: hydrogenase formation protein HypD [Elusimicrobia bacterium]|nr:MAG: hydrogenase formation protein HypD [Elusimicrobiota bacterium]
MKFVDEFRDKAIAERIVKKIKRFDSLKVNLMEVCGTHTMVIFKQGLKGILPKNVNLLSGPGCPVCVTSQEDIDKAIELAKDRNVIITTFGDMIRVPGTNSSLEKERGNGADVRIIYSPSEALRIARENPAREVVFLAIGFETTSPLIAASLLDAQKEKIDNFYIFSSHKLIPPAMEALLESKEVRIDGFICPGHVSVTIGSNAYKFIAQKYNVPCVIGGFEPLDVLQSIYMLLKQIKEKRAEVEIEYFRAVHPQGNRIAQELIAEVFEVSDVMWRGLGTIPKSGLRLKRKFSDFDAEKEFQPKTRKSKENPDCACGEVLRGVKKPTQCKLYRKICTPEEPYGPCMVSSEGTCAAYYKYG